ncbi:zinc ribbon-containing protein [Thiospirillum jenense]|uniref:Zinc ribbon-containing protein n=1 Tax=Thiospirillum jenense TaxID=1653858 RepID=A0A839H8T8_9GAMM|nr:zinc ribbon-containing protein [Thiospirillum jenense]MBB1125384.1 zinc ribbon-containing protein [Thiospirillum jenense]
MPHSTDPITPPPSDLYSNRLIRAYERMLDLLHVHSTAEADNAAPVFTKLRDQLAAVRDRMVELGELTREEANRIGDYLERDLHDAASYLVTTGDDLRNWWRFDVALIEERILTAFTSVADQTSLQLRQLQHEGRQFDRYQTGDITAPGTLRCTGCGAAVTLTQTGCIPACPACGGTQFGRSVMRG